jgi:alpha-galactosidase
VGYIASDRWGDEGRFEWHPVPTAGLRIDARYRRDRYRHPMFVLRNNATGEHVIGQVAWSGGTVIELDLDADPLVGDGTARLWFRMGPDGPAPLRVLDPGETVRTPEVHLGMLFGDLDTAVQAMHDHVRASVWRPQPRGRGGWVESGIGPEVEITTSAVHEQIDRAALLGAEVFFIDASWYTPPGGPWYDTVGDWQVDHARFPDGVGPFRDHVRERGMLFGLWMDAERLGSASRTLAEHPDWLATDAVGRRRLGGMLDLTRPEVADWMERNIAQVIEEEQLDFFRLDQNTGTTWSSASSERHGYLENAAWRYHDALYGVWDRIRERFPDVILENCAGGGGRTDIAMVQRFSHTDITDWQIGPRSFRVTNGMTIALPPESVDRLVGGQDGHTTASIDFQARLLLFARPSVTIFDPPGARTNPDQVARIRHMVDLFTGFVRPYLRDGRIYHHTPTLAGAEPQGWGVLESASRDRARALVGVFRLSAPGDDAITVRPRGLDRGRRYRVTWDDSGQTAELDGVALMEAGLLIRRDGALTSELLLFEAMDA